MNTSIEASRTQKKIKPISVKVHWSESREFDEDTHYDFMDFERKALEVAKTNPRGGYDKTKVTVLFDNEDRYECRLDLGCGGNDAGFASHCLNMLAYYLRHQHDVDKSWLHDQHHLSLIEAIQNYEFDTAFVENAKQDIEQAEMNAKAEDEAKAHKNGSDKTRSIKRRRKRFKHH
ncbi:LPD25 domain-containing protein [Vibrio owensii]|uniref:LPD25 domain-containing protein n=1 Tax=Vibrio owensii TaxID=696485 RepID=UPI002D78843D|nr:LPD25 domain-containing protein [Vibrio owensii]